MERYRVLPHSNSPARTPRRRSAIDEEMHKGVRGVSTTFIDWADCPW